MPLYLKDKLVSGTGTPGKSAYEAAVEAGYTGTETAFNEALSDVPGHIDNMDNPHGVTAAQVNAYTKGETDTLLQEKADSTALQSHIANTENPHRVTAAQAGAIASTEKGSASGVATLGADSLLAAAQRPKAGGLYRDDGETTLEASLAEISTTLQNKAPAGYGLGDVARWIEPTDDLNNIKTTGWYRWFDPPINAPGSFGAMTVVVTETDGRLVQEVVFVLPEFNGTYNFDVNCKVRRICYQDTWQPWEWENPPMILGIEYRTTERYLGKPVYTMLVDFGSFPNSTQKDVAIPEKGFFAHNVCIDFTKSVVTYPNDHRTSILPFKNGITEISVNNACVRVTTSSDLSSASGYICVKYTKSTD